MPTLGIRNCSKRPRVLGQLSSYLCFHYSDLQLSTALALVLKQTSKYCYNLSECSNQVLQLGVVDKADRDVIMSQIGMSG